MKRLVFVGSVLGTVAAFIAACPVVLAMLIWLKAWLEEASKQRYPNCSGSPAYWRDGTGGACLSLRFEGRRRRMYEAGLGNGVYSVWGSHCSMSAADEEELRALLGVDVTDWNTGQAVH